jgi:zinc protease
VAARRTTRDGVVCGEVDGVPTFWSPKREGPAAALLMFRVGQADETLPSRGVSHLVEHLSLVPTGKAPHDFNGQTGTSTTTFGMVGLPSELVSFFGVLGSSLSALPLERLPAERTVLQTEEQGRGHSSTALWSLRWGPQGHGLVGYDELGVQGLDGEAVQAWADEWFVRQNAVLVLNGPPPRGLRLPLRDGVRAAPPVVEQAIDPLPTWYPQQPPSFGLSYLRDRSAASGVAAWLLQERVNDVMRHEQGLVYGVAGSSLPLSSSVRHDVLWTQALDEKLDEAVAALLDVLAAGPSPMTPAERKAWAAQKREQRRHAASAVGSTGWAAYLAEAALYGDEAMTLDEFQAEAAAVREPDVLAALSTFAESMLLALPEGTDAGAVAPPIRQWSRETLAGKALRPAHGQDWQLLLAREGVTMVDAPDRAVTVRFAETAAVRAWDDGARQLLGEDGFQVIYRPEQWQDEPAAVARAIDSGVGIHKVVHVGSRTPVEAPVVEAPADGASKPVPWHAMVVDLALLSICVVFLIGGAFSPYVPEPGETQGDRIGIVITAGVISALLALPYVLRRRSHRSVRRAAVAVLVIYAVVAGIGFLVVPDAPLALPPQP